MFADVSQAVQSVDCKVSVDDDQLAAIKDDGWTSGGDEGLTVKVQVTNSQLMINETCNYIRPDPESDLIQGQT